MVKTIADGPSKTIAALDLAVAVPPQRGVGTDPRIGLGARRGIADATRDGKQGEVREVEVTVLPPKVTSASAVCLTVPVPALTGQAADVTLQIMKQPEPPVDLQITQIPKKEILLYKAYGRNKGHYFDLKESHRNTLQEIFYHIKQHCLNTNQVSGDATGFTISWSNRIIRFYDPGTHNIRLLDLEVIMRENPDIHEKVLKGEELITGINKRDIRASKFAPNNKGAVDGPTPLCRSNSALQTLPKSTGDRPYNVALTLSKDVLTDDEKKDIAIRRMVGMETILKKVKDKVAAEKALLVPLLEQATQAGNQVEVNRFQKNMNQLVALEEKLDEVDTCAICCALAFWPTGGKADPQEVRYRAEQLHMLMGQMVEEVRKTTIEETASRSWLPKWVSSLPFGKTLRGETDIEPSGAYSLDAAGLLFSGLESPQSRSSYAEFCNANQSSFKRECLEDALVKEVLRPGSEASGQNQVLTDLFKSITDPQIQARLNEERDAAIALIGTHQGLVLNGSDAKSRAADLRRQVGL